MQKLRVKAKDMRSSALAAVLYTLDRRGDGVKGKRPWSQSRCFAIPDLCENFRVCVPADWTLVSLGP